MLTPGEMARFLEISAARVRHELKREAEHLLEGAATEARALIGHEMDEWPPLADATVAEKQRLGFTGQVSSTDPLLRTGRLRESIQSGAEETAEGAEGALGSDDVVALYQEQGTGGAHPIPPRPFLQPSMVSAEARSHEAFGELAVELLTPGVR